MAIKTMEEYIEANKSLRASESRLRGLMCSPDDERDRERIERERVETREWIGSLERLIADTPESVRTAAQATRSYPCAGARDGCTTRVRTQGDYCRRCAFDADD